MAYCVTKTVQDFCRIDHTTTVLAKWRRFQKYLCALIRTKYVQAISIDIRAGQFAIEITIFRAYGTAMDVVFQNE